MPLSRTYACLVPVLYFTVTLAVRSASEITHLPDELLNVTERAIKHGFEATEHSVETEDGYILTLFRLRRGAVAGPPVVLMHGLLQSAASWTDAGAGAALGYLVAGGARDLWLGNVRGSHYSRRHAALAAARGAYWRFCVDEIGRYDLPATLDYVLRRTGARALHYVGFSQGAGAFYIMCSERPDYCDKVSLMISLAPATRHYYSTYKLFTLLSQFFETYEQNLISSGYYEAFPKGNFVQAFTYKFCTVATKACEKIFLDGSNPGAITDEVLRVASAGFPAGTSTHNLSRYGQSTRTKLFQKFDYGPKKNYEMYGTRTPPVYNLSAVTVPTVVLYGRNDGIVDIRDVKWLLAQLPNVVEAVEVQDPGWTHFNMVLSWKVPRLVYPIVEKYLDMYSG